jgi:hypothetical protein
MSCLRGGGAFALDMIRIHEKLKMRKRKLTFNESTLYTRHSVLPR